MLVSIIIPTFNRAGMLREAIESALGQTYSRYEILVVDDGSTDDTESVVSAYGGPVRYVKRENGGVGAARNTGLAMARGDLVAFLDSDDMWKPSKLEVQVRLFERLPRVGLVFSEFEVLKDDGRRVPRGSRTWLAPGRCIERFYERADPLASYDIAVDGLSRDVVVHTGNIYRALLDEGLVLTSTAVVRRDAMPTDSWFPEGIQLYEDWDFFARVARVHDAAFVDVETTVNRGHDGPRVTDVSRLDRVRMYIGMLERVWKSDARFVALHGEDLRRIEARSWLALAREAILTSRADLAGDALRRWAALREKGEARGWAAVYRTCRTLPAGGSALRWLLRARTAWRVLRGEAHGGYSINPTV